MYSKIAMKNVKKSFKDYSIYFLTLTLAVCIFYSFNSIESQKAFMEMSSSGAEFIDEVSAMISCVSVFVAVILGSLIIYANNFLIKKRNKELGIYMTLGMGKAKISKILIFETIIVGVLSLISGLIIGFIASQGLSVLVVKLFQFKMNKFTFVVSISAIGKTIFYFGIMFLLVMIFNTFVISKYKIIDLLTVGRKNEEIKLKNPMIYFITFIICVISLSSAYKLVIDVGLEVEDPRFIISIILGIIGTVLFFFSLTGFILYIVKKNKSIYFKGLNIFIIKQINSKVKTNFISMSVICLMLFVTIVTLSTGFSFKNALESGLEEATPYDFSAYLYIDSDYNVISIEESLNKMGIKFTDNDKVAYYDEYSNGENLNDIMNLNQSDGNFNPAIRYIKISDYNKMRAISNEEPIELEKDEVLVTSTVSKILPDIKEYMSKNDTLSIENTNYKIKNKKVIENNLSTDYMKNNFCTIVINDEFCDKAEVILSRVNVNFKLDKDKSQDELMKLIDDFNDRRYSYSNDSMSSSVDKDDYEGIGYVMASSRNYIYESNRGVTTTILFIGIYLGIVFLISSMAVLALQQLSEASDSIDRYISLRRLGVSKKSINKTIFMQTLVYFSIPVVLAFVHSIVGIKVTNTFISLYNQPNIAASSLITAGIFLIMYIIYFNITYIGYKNIVKSKIK